MDLPLDHFRLLGVHPATDAQAVLNTLQQRLESHPRDGFTDETLRARDDLLRASADVLSDQARRGEYENTLTALAGAADPLMPALEVPYALETGGLLLLLEAGQGADCLELACRALQPPQAPALGSGREADLALLAGLASRSAAEEMKQSRRFEQAAQTLERGLHLLQRMGQRPDLRQRIALELDRLAPFRVLDLLSRDLTARQERQQGLDLLEELVQRRGGLEGEGDPEFSPEEFQLFFRQIRDFLTVQEQIDLTTRWSEAGSTAADRLAVTALTASGFVQRKPDRIAEARRRLTSARHQGVEATLAHLHLLLGEVDRAQEQSQAGGDPLADLCARCREWLGREVLPGFRDLDPTPDLDAYFSDQDVQEWVEREDRRSGRHYAATPAEAAPASAAPAGSLLNDFDLPTWPELSLQPGGDPAVSSPASRLAGPRGASFGVEPDPSAEGDAPLRLPRLADLKALPLPGLRLVLIAAGTALAAALGFWALQRRPAPVALPVVPGGQVRPQKPTAAPSAPAAKATAQAGQKPTAQAAAKPTTQAAAKPTAAAGPGSPVPATPQPPAAAEAPTPASSFPLRSASPDATQLRGLLEAWLAAKVKVLAGGPLPAELNQLARTSAIERLREERGSDQVQGLTQHIKVKVQDVRINERSADRIALVATLLYSDEQRDTAGKVVERTPEIVLRNVYVFARDGQTWRFVANRSAS